MRIKAIKHSIFCSLLFAFILITGCNVTEHLKANKHLLRSTSVSINADKSVKHKGEMSDHLNSLILQKPNSYFIDFWKVRLFPYKVWFYNHRYKRYQNDTTAAQLKKHSVEAPVAYDSLLARRSSQNMKSFLLNQGFFYSKVRDTVQYRKKFAFVTYKVNTSFRYLINNLIFDVDDSEIKSIVTKSMSESNVKKDETFSFTMLDEERSRIVTLLHNNGYYKFSNENVAFEIDTFNKSALVNTADTSKKGADSTKSTNTLSDKKIKPQLDVKYIIRANGNLNVYRKYGIGEVIVYPDFVDAKDLRSKDLITKSASGITFRYHNYFVRENVLQKRIFLLPGAYYSQDDYDLTITKLNDLGIFQYVRLILVEDSTLPKDKPLKCYILLNPSKKYDYTNNFEVSSGSTYVVGSAVSVAVHNRNLDKGADQLNTSLSGGIELGFDTTIGHSYIGHYFEKSRNYGFNISIDFPKFIAPINQKRISRRNLPRTIIGFGTSLLDRLNYFTLTNTTANFTYNFKESKNVTYDISPAFINILRLPKVSDSFQRRLDTNEFLRNSYRKNFIEGENFTVTFSDLETKRGRNYSYIKAGIEEAGTVLSGIKLAGEAINKTFSFDYAQYLKFDLDARYYFTLAHNDVFVVRFFGGVGLPYGNSDVLPYIKQYFVGGAYSIRGWRVRTLGPGSANPDSLSSSNAFIDRTGDIKLEGNAEFRAPLFRLFSGAIKFNGAAFADAGNIWLSHPDPAYPGGEFRFSTLGQDIAVSTGLGIRADIGGFFVVRLDAAFPIKKPYILQNGGWVIDQLNFGNKDWRTQNIILNVAVGYPF